MITEDRKRVLVKPGGAWGGIRVTLPSFKITTNWLVLAPFVISRNPLVSLFGLFVIASLTTNKPKRLTSVPAPNER